MNVRIQKLAEQQGLTGPNYLISSQELEKFAVSIIKECIIISQVGSITETRLKQHFGFEQ